MQRDGHPASGDQIAEASGVIKVYVRELDQLFDSWNPSPFHEKGLNNDAHEYIVGVAKELPAGAPAALLVYLAKPIGVPDEARLLGEAIRVYFARRAAQQRRTMRQFLRRGWISLAIGLTLLASSVIVGEMVARRMGQGPLATVLRESLLIGGWVAMWRPAEMLLYDYWTMRADQRMYERLSNVVVQVVYTGTAAAGGDGGAGDGTLKEGREAGVSHGQYRNQQ